MSIIQQGQNSRYELGQSSHDTSRRGYELTIDGIVASYCQLQESETTNAHEMHIAGKDLLWNALIKYDKGRKDALANPDMSETLLKENDDTFYTFVAKAQDFNLYFPADILKSISIGLINFALDSPRNTSREVRCAAADLGIGIGSGDESVNIAKALTVKEHHKKAVEQNISTGNTIETDFREKLAVNMFHSFGVTVDRTDVPSIAESAKQYTQKHARGVATTGITAVMATTVVLSPSLAVASEFTPAPTIQLPEQNVMQGENDFIISPIFDNSDETMPPKEKVVPIIIDLTPLKMSEAEKANDATTETPDTVTEPKTEVKVVIDLESNELIFPAPENVPTPTPVEYPTPETPTTSDQEVLTTEEKKVQERIETIVDTINTDSDIDMATSLIRLGFYAKGSSYDVSGEKQAAPLTTNPALIINLDELQIAVENTVKAKGHADVHYSNEAFMTLAVLKAIANDQTVWQSEDVKKLVAAAKAPDDPYQAKLFERYLKKAADALSADSGALLANIDAGPEDIIHTQIKTMYAYALLATVSDTDQTSEIQTIKDDEAKVAADKAKAIADEAKAIADAAKAQEQANNPQSAEAEAMKNLTDSASTEGSKRVYYAFSFFKQHTDLSVNQISGIISGLLGESGVNLDPGAIEEVGGYGHGIAQWERGRFEALKEYANAHGKEWTNFELQLDFLLSELPGRNNTLDLMKEKETIFDAAKVFVIKFETPRVVLNALDSGDWSEVDAEVNKRIGMGQHYLDALNAEINAVNAARAAVEAVPVVNEATEAERQAKMGMTFEQAEAFTKTYAESPDSASYIGRAATDCNGGALSNCVSLSVYFVNKYTSLGGMVDQLPGNGKGVVDNIVDRNPDVQSGTTARPLSVFSKLGGKYGHTGLILGIDENKLAADGTQGVVIVSEAFCTSQSHNGKVKEYPLAQLNNGEYEFAYSDGHLKRSPLLDS